MMTVNGFLDNLQSAGYWRERCKECGETFDAPDGEERCPPCEKERQEAIDEAWEELHEARRRGDIDQVEMWQHELLDMGVEDA